MAKERFSHLSDIELIDKYQASQNSAYVGELYQRYTHLVYAVCYKYFKNADDSKDATMQIFEKLLKDLQTQNIQNFKSWLHVVTKNHCLMHLRASKAQQNAFSDADLVENEAIPHHTEQEQNIAIDDDKLSQLIESLNPQQKICIHMFYLEQLSYKEIQHKTGMSLNEIKSYIQNGKRNLKILITKQNLLLILLCFTIKIWQ